MKARDQGDAMHNYALYNNRYRSAAFQLIADDDVRDYGHPEKESELRKQWEPRMAVRSIMHYLLQYDFDF